MDKYRKAEIERERKNNPHQGVKAIPKNTLGGILLWELPSGNYLGDSDGNYLSCAASLYDLDTYKRNIKKMEQAAAAYGFPEGKCVFLAGYYQVSDMMYEDQMAAFTEGEDVPGDID